MTAAKGAAPNELHMSGKEFDRIMGQALQVKPKDGKRAKPPEKAKAARKRKAGRK